MQIDLRQTRTHTQEEIQTREARRVPVPGLREQTGLGDVVAAVTRGLGMTPCTPCEERRRRLNQAVQFTSWG